MKKQQLKSMKIRFSILIVLISIVPMIVIGLMARHILSEKIKLERIKTIGHIADAKHDQLAMLLKRANDRAASLLLNLNSRCNVNQLNEACSANLLKLYLLSEQAIGATLNEYRTRKNVIVGESAIQRSEFITFKNGQYADFSGKKGTRKESYFILVTDKSTGYQLAVTYPVSNLQSLFDRPQDLGSFGETFLSDGDGYFVTEPRYPSVQGISHPIHAGPMQSCLHGENREVLDSDYRDHPVIHSFRFTREFGAGCIMAHADQKEAFSELNAFNWNLNIILLISMSGIIALSVYITRRFLINEKLQQEFENKFQAIFKSAKDMFFILDQNGIISDVNEICQSRLGYTRDEMIGKHITEFAAMEGAKKAPVNFEELIKSRHILLETTIVSKDGTEIPIETNANLIEQNGKQMIFAIHRDLTLRKELENALTKREARYRAIAETSADGFWITDMQGRFLEVNNAYLQRSGYTRQEMLSMAVTDVEASEKPEDTARHIEKVFKYGHDRFESLHRAKDGSIWPVEIHVNFYNISTEQLLFVFVTDITERKKILSELKQSNESIQKILDNAPISTALSRIDGHLVYVNEAFCKTMGYSRDELEKMSIKDVTYQDDQKLTSAYIKDLLEGTVQVFSGEKRYVRKDGGMIWTHLTAAIHKDASGELYLIAQIEDITQRKIAEENLRESENKFRVLFNTAKDSLFILDLKGYFVDINPAGCENLGYNKQEIVGQHISEFVPPDLKAGIRERMERVIADGHATFDSANIRKDGTLIIVEVNAQLIEQGGVHYLFSINRNITARKQMEDKLREKEALSRAVIERILDS